MFRVMIYFAGAREIGLSSNNIAESDLMDLVHWFENEKGPKVRKVVYNMNGTTITHIINREYIAYITTSD